MRALLRMALYYGIAGFGGGYSVLAQMRRDLVDRKAWISPEEFMVFAEVSKSLPGTAATNLLALLGQRMTGSLGGALATTAFLLPSAVLMAICGATYSLFRQAPALALFFDGMNAAMVGVVAAVTLELAWAALRSRADVALSLLCAVLLVRRVVSEPVLAAVAILFGAILGNARQKPSPDAREQAPQDRPGPLHAISALALPTALVGSLAAIASLVQVFVPIGVTTFGGGLAMIPAIEHRVVLEHGWLDSKGFADAIALGQITPGPVAICATFIGYRVAGWAGALTATVSMFAPATALALAVGRYMERFRASTRVQGALRALAPAVIGMLTAATYSLGHTTMASEVDIVLAMASFALQVARPMGPLWLLIAGGVIRIAIVHFGVAA